MQRHVFHITERAAFAASLESGAYRAESLAREGFIHCSTLDQLLGTARRFFAGKQGLVLLCIAVEGVAADLRFEPADGAEFPHCYGPIPLESIVAVLDFPCDAGGGFELPEELRVFTD